MRSLLVAILLVGSVVLGACGDDSKPNTNTDAGVDTPDGGEQNEMFCESLPPTTSGGTCDVTSLGATKLIKGNILTPQTVFIGGQVAVNAEGQITCAGCNCAQGGETVISCPGATVSPGLINTHDHITYTQNAPYNDTGERYDDRQQWRIGGSSFEGHTKIPAPGGASSEKVSYGELRFLMGGATSIVGSGGAAGLLRNLDRANQQEGLGKKAVNFETFPLGDTSGGRRDGDCNYPSNVTPASVANDDAYEPHTAEGIDKWAHNEFKCQSSETFDTTAPGLSQNLLLPKTAMIHAIGLTAGDYGAMAQATTALIWSPRSNITLYGDTARVTTAARQGVEIALGTDWTPSGSINLLRELRCADSLNKTYMDSYFSDKQLWEMVTLNAAAVTATDDVIGMLAPNHVADISIFKANNRTAYRAILEADPQDVALVMRAGKILYGDDGAVDSLASECDTVDVCGTMKRVCLKSEIGKTLAELQTAVGSIYPAFACPTPTNEPSCTPKRPTSVSGSTVYTGEVSATDSDGDGIADTADNCPKVFNPIRPMDLGMQADADGDGQGDSCDVCPTDANTTTCTAVDPNDSDHDGVTNTSDNCPNVANPGQTDGDGDGKGDACDACPSDSNPGTQGCPSTIYLVKMGAVADGTPVRITNALVTGKGSNGFFVQTKVGDAGYIDENYSGMFVFTGASTATLMNAVVGQRVTIDGNAATFQGQKELDIVTTVTATTMTTEPLPSPISATYAEVKSGGSRAPQLEGVIVQVGAGSVTARDTTQNEFTLTAGADSVSVDDFLAPFSALPTVGTTYSSMTGVLALRGNAMRLLPRGASDFGAGAPGLTGFGPALSFTRVGSTGTATIPATGSLTVTLGAAAQGDTDVTVTSGDTNALTVVGSKVTVLNGSTTATVLVNGLAQAADVTLTAQLGSGTPLTAHVRVLGAGEVPATVTLSPMTATISPAAMQQFTATLDIPAPAGGSTIALDAAPSGVGTLNPTSTLTIPADTLAGTFSYTDVMGMTATVSAALAGGNTANATVMVSAAAQHLVINEIDYDMVGTGDNMEYVEIYNPSTAAISLTNVSLVLVNGNNAPAGSPYTTVALGSAGSIPAGGYLVVAGANVTVPASAQKLMTSWNVDAVQNGAPDGVALIDTAAHTVIDALSYEGSITSVMFSGFPAMVSIDEGTTLDVSVADSNTVLGSLCRSPNGTDTDNANADWTFCTTLTPGTANP